MIEKRGNLWDFYKQQNAVICITTNGFVKRNGECVMGRGCALEASKKFPGFSKLLGEWINQNGNYTHFWKEQRLVTFPVKHVWWQPANLDLITQSALRLGYIADELNEFVYYLPRPGCGNGQRNWHTEVKPLLESLKLPDNIIIVTF